MSGSFAAERIFYWLTHRRVSVIEPASKKDRGRRERGKRGRSSKENLSSHNTVGTSGIRPPSG